MLTSLFIPIICGMITGLALGLTGGGGSIFAVPLLTFVVGLPVAQSTALSLIAVCITAGIGATRGLIRGIASVKIAVPMLITGMIVSPFGVMSSNQVPEKTRLLLFALLMVIISVKMFLGQIASPRASVFTQDDKAAVGKDTLFWNLLRLTRHPLVVLSIGGACTGFLSGFFGVGGGFLIVPTLVFATRLQMHQIISTSMLIISGVSLIAFSTFLFSPLVIPPTIATSFIAGNIAGLTIGITLASKLSSSHLQKVFATGIAVVGLCTGTITFLS